MSSEKETIVRRENVPASGRSVSRDKGLLHAYNKTEPFRERFTVGQSENKPDDREFFHKKIRDKGEIYLDLWLEKFQNSSIGYSN